MKTEPHLQAHPGILIGGQPTATDLRNLAKGGLKTVIDLRGVTEPRGYDEKQAAEAERLTYHLIPVEGEFAPSAFDAVRRVLSSPEARPVLIHCASSNRAGAALIPYLILDEGRSPQEALAIAKSAGLRTADFGHDALAYVESAEGGGKREPDLELDPTERN